MIDSTLERQASDLKELLALWQQFGESMAIGTKNDNITPEKEDFFLQLKSRLAELHDTLMEAIPPDQRNVGSNMLDIIIRSITLKHLSKMSQADIKKTEMEWHESFLAINDVIHHIDEKRAELAPIDERKHKAKKQFGAIQQQVLGFLLSPAFKASVVLAAVLFATLGVQVLGIYDYNQIGRVGFLKVPYQAGKGLVRLIDKVSPYVVIDTWSRPFYGNWPSQFKDPTIKSTSTGDLSAAAGPPGAFPAMAEAFGKAKEYRHENFDLGMKGIVDIHTMLFETADQAKAAETAYSEAARGNKTLANLSRALREVNILTVVTSKDNSDRVNDAFIGMGGK